MDPNSLLDYALFQLTPTRTRCDLVIFCKGRSEKLASGLVEPFISHLKYAKDEIPKGGYSIKLCPPKSDPLWFTKSTFHRFVRFVSTPEVLERFARLEKEILQIENSVQSNEFANNNVAQVEEGNLSNVNGITKQSPNASRVNGDSDESLQEENSKIALQRLLETRKALLRKEQAMAYARALAAGFELENLDDLIHFADTFGASRLREACKEFKDLCMKKHTDDLWMNELAAMKAMPQSELPFLGSSGIILAPEMNPYQNNAFNFENNGKLVSHDSLDASSDSIISQENLDGNKDQTPPKVPMTWQTQIPPYMYKFQNPGQQVPPYQAYPFPYYPPNMHWPQNGDESEYHRNRRSSSSRKKEKTRNLEEEEEEEEEEPSDSETETESEVTEKSRKKKHGKKSSKTVVIRNINYITSKKRNEGNDGVSYDSSSGDDEVVDEDYVRDVLGTLEKGHKSKSNSKKKSGNKNRILVNGSNESNNEELESNLNVNSSNGNENWGAFQNLLMSEKDSKEDNKTFDVSDEHFVVKSSNGGDIYGNGDSIHFGSEKFQTRKNVGIDSFIVRERSEVNQGGNNLKDLENGEISRPVMKISNYEDESVLFPQRSEETKSIITGKSSDISSESTVIKSGTGEDWFVVNHSEKLENRDSSFEQIMVRDSYALSPNGANSESKKIVPIDDSFMVQAHSPIDDHYDSHWKTDISMESGIFANDQSKNDSQEPLNKVKYEPDDLCVVLTRDPGFVSVGDSWSSEVDYGVEASFVEPESKPVCVETNDKIEEKKPIKGKSPTNGVAKQTRPKGLQASFSKSRLDALSKSKTPISRSMSQKSKLEKEEESRRRAEELVIERQKRIAERSAAKGPAAAKKVPLGNKVT